MEHNSPPIWGTGGTPTKKERKEEKEMKKKVEPKKIEPKIDHYNVNVYEPGRKLKASKKFNEHQDAIETAKLIFIENQGCEVEIESWADGQTCQETECVRKGRWFLYVVSKD